MPRPLSFLFFCMTYSSDKTT